jgi:transcriptional regulator with XRE-family HTH domain
MSDTLEAIRMDYSSEPILHALKETRQKKGLSQRELSAKAGVPQGHISKIESGLVDLKLSSLIALARILDLEVMTVPRSLVPAVQAIMRSGEPATRDPETGRLALKLVKRIEKTLARLGSVNSEDRARLQRAARELAHLPVGRTELDLLREAAEVAGKIESGAADASALRDASAALQRTRNSLVHRITEEPVRPQRPAYSLEDGDGDA